MRRLVFMGILSAAWSRRATGARGGYDFSAGSWIIPMDACYQPSQPFNGTSFQGTNDGSTLYGADTSLPRRRADRPRRPPQGLRPRLSPAAEQRARLLHPRHQQDRRRRHRPDHYQAAPARRSRWSRTAAASRTTATPPSSWTRRTPAISYRGAPFIISRRRRADGAQPAQDRSRLHRHRSAHQPRVFQRRLHPPGQGEHPAGAGARHPLADAAQDRAHGHRRRRHRRSRRATSRTPASSRRRRPRPTRPSATSSRSSPTSPTSPPRTA